MKPAEKRPRGKRLPPMQDATKYVVLLSQAMELVDDITLLKMRANELLRMICATREKP